MATKPVLYSYFRSSCSWRVRIALAIKGVEYDYKGVNLLKGEQLGDEYKAVNPSGQVPCLEIDGMKLTQSLSIMEYLEETRSGTALLPKDPKQRALVRQICEVIAGGIQPLQNLSVLKAIGADRKTEWGHDMIAKGFRALETFLENTAGRYCVGDDVTMADCCLVPQVYNANRFQVDMSKFPIIARINTALLELDTFKVSDPVNQPDCPEDLRK
ncbi:maleylacetoacetate isomerase-like isoform X2 [Amphiura filiformis]|uniref:maleylacetoacetate isomerase-like isoform X2 n=1 Tax=Amphiura filiformis TaxID=82378 RepID=UPI003B228C0B